MTTSRFNLRSRLTTGYSLPELIACVSLIAIIATIAVVGSSNIQRGVRTTKLTSDVQSLNAVVSIYVANGGSLSGITDPQDVLNHLKAVLTQSEKTRNVGTMTGRGVDARLSARMQSKTEADSSNARALWDSKNLKFIVSTASGSQGISSFDLDSKLADAVVSNEVRARSSVLYNGSAGWVWDSADANAQPPLAPWGHDLQDVANNFNPSGMNPPIAGGGSPPPGTPPGGTTPPGTPPPGTTTPPGTTSPPGTIPPVTTATPMTLPTPVITPPGGAFFKPMFPTLIYINRNGAPGGSSVLEYRLNNGPWIIYTGPFVVANGTAVTARNFSTNSSLYIDSPDTKESYFSLVTSFSGGVGAKWNASTGPSGLVSSADNSNPDSVVEADGTAITAKNTFTFKRGQSFSGITPNSFFKLGEIVYHNGTIRSGTGSTGLSLHLDLTLTNPAVATAGTNIIMKLDNTPNTSLGALSADACTLANPVTSYSVEIGGVTYTLVLKYGTISADQGYVSGDTLNVWEGADGHVEILAAFASSIPL